jgi:dihydrofolate reductase
VNSARSKVSVFIATSLDGYIARSDGDVAWLHEIEPIGDGDDAGYELFFDSIDVLVMGRGSFEKVLEFDWPYGTKPLIVLSKSLTELPDHLHDRVTIDASPPRELVERLWQEGYKHIYLDGGRVIQSFLREGLVDNITLTTVPVLIGKGIPLFGDLEKDIQCRLLESRSWANGLVQSRYQVST